MIEQWFVYILQCADTSLYCGVTTDLSRRLFEHNNTRRASKYVASRRPATLVYQEGARDRSSALRREAQIKKLSRRKKLEIINQGCAQSTCGNK
jgi:putative endonuclease